MVTPAFVRSSCVILRFKDGKCVEHWGVSDDAGMMQQLGNSAAK